MARDHDPFAPHAHHGCDCAHHATATGHEPVSPAASVERQVDAAIVRALFPRAAMRRRFLATVGSAAVMAALELVFPLAAARALAQDAGRPEKPKLKIGFLPITCATPLIVAESGGFFGRAGLNVELQRVTSWALVRDRVLNGEYDVSHMLAPMPLAISLGLGAQAQPLRVVTIQNVNGNAITLHVNHRNRRDPKDWKGFRFGIPFEQSMHNLLLRYYLAENGLDPDRDVELRVMPPPDTVANLRAGQIDGFIVAEPFGQRAIFEGFGFQQALTSELWDGHPCCTVTTTAALAREHPSTFAALFRAMVEATRHASAAANRRDVAAMIAAPNYLNQPPVLVEQVLTGRYADGLGNIRDEPRRIDFDAFPWQSMAVWILTQMRRWNYLPRDVQWRDVAEAVFQTTDARRRLREMGLEAPESVSAAHMIMGRTFDAGEPDAYLARSPIRRL
jgi:nitrate/nitrite transport system substrate-binding protein